MSFEYRSVDAPDNFNVRDPRHVAMLMKKLSEKGLSEGWTVQGHAEGKIILARRSAMNTAIDSKDGETVVSLGGEYRASDGEKARKRLEADPRFEGLSLVSFDPHLDRAILAKLSDGEKRVREAVAAVVTAKPWDVRITTTPEGGFRMQMPGDRYQAAKHDEKLQQLAETVAGAEGWYVRSDPKASTVEFVPSDPPTFDATIDYPFALLDRGSKSDMRWVMDLPVGLALGAPGEENPLLSLPLDGNPGALVTGTPGGGKAQPLGELVLVPVSDRHPDGHAAIGSLRVGDEVLTWHGKPAAVTSLSPITQQLVYELTLETGQQCRVTADHLSRVTTAEMLAAAGDVTSSDLRLAERMRTLAQQSVSANGFDERSIADAFGVQEVEADALLQHMLGPLAIDVPGDDPLFPADEALIAVASWLEHGRSVPWLIRTTEQLREHGGWLLPTPQPRRRVITPAAVRERNELAHRILSGDPVGLGEVRTGDGYDRQVLARAVRELASAAGLVDGLTWTVPETARDIVADVLRADGALVTVRDDSLTVIADAWTVALSSIERIGVEHARCIVVDDPEHLYLTGSWIVTHNSVSINAVVYGLLRRGWKVAIGDTIDKAADFEWCKPFVMQDGFGCQGPASTAAMISMIYDMREERGRLIKQYGVTKWQELPAQHRPPPVCVILDEVEGLFGLQPEPKSLPRDHPLRVEAAQHNFEVELLKTQVGKIVAQLRFVGIRVILATQQAQANTGLSPALKMKLPNRLLMGKLANDQVRGHALQSPRDAPSVPDNLKRDESAGRGVGVAELDGRSPTVFKSFYSDTAEFARRLDAAGVPRTSRPETSQRIIEKYVDRLDGGEEEGYGHGQRRLEAWEVGPDGKPLTGFERANAARHAATVGAKD